MTTEQTECKHTEAKQGRPVNNIASGWNWCEGCGCLVRFKTEEVVAEVLRPLSQRTPKLPPTD